MKTLATRQRCLHRVRRRSAAFSLVEVTIAVAIAALGFITLLGLLPSGINMARTSAEMSVGSKIMLKLSGEMQSMAWSRINWTGYGPLRYFTNEGREMTPADTSQDDLVASLAFVASVYVPQKPLDMYLPTGVSGAGTSTPETYLRRVKICVTTSSDPAFKFDSASPLRISSTYALIAKMGD
ncbi:MAG: Verru_Chthon cassette protein B [Prosthecobacter sp.]|uniref:Verru_Chthon cassette protein B n=1 Tax=Prosthecobacter sp. TaxID=1965333 RepID=UPI0025F678CA|nr:Verru_Chthon cassette protein B [Prosthecobacter sp.]MCF7787003.1 Verru_Chthon cassette protein B [Prosthecobacter sp.]